LAKPEDITSDDKANQLDRIFASIEPQEIANKAIVARYVYATNILEVEVFDKFVAPDFVDHDPIPGQEPGLEGLKKAYHTFLEPFPDVLFVFEDIIAEDDLVFGRGVISGTHQGEFFGIPATGKRIHWTGTRLFRLQDGKVTEGWINLDFLGLLQQMGAVPAPPAPPAPETPPPHLTGAPASRDETKAIMRRLIDDFWNGRDESVADELFHPESSSPSAPGLPPGPEGVKQIARMFWTAFPDYWMRIDYIAGEDDRVAARFTQGGTHQGDLFGIPPTGKAAEWTEMGILRIADGKIVESWYDVDMAGLMQQLGVGGDSGGEQAEQPVGAEA
jgi:predicted ester cyclase